MTQRTKQKQHPPFIGIWQATPYNGENVYLPGGVLRMTNDNQTATSSPSASTKPTQVAVATINAGACGFISTVRAICREKRMVTIDIETECPNIRELGENLPELEAFKEIGWRGGSTVYDLMAKYARHVSCPVGSGIVKAMEVAAGLNLPREASISVVKENAG
jgi:hypothetical protein